MLTLQSLKKTGKTLHIQPNMANRNGKAVYINELAASMTKYSAYLKNEKNILHTTIPDND